MTRIFTTTIRLNLNDEADRKAWEYLQKREKSYTRTIVTAINGYYDRQERLANDPYLETREKEDAFLQKVLDTVERGASASAPLGGFLQLLQEKQSAVPASQPPDEDMATVDAALDFADSF